MKLRDPDFGTNLVNYIFGPKDGDTLNEVKSEISSQVGKYVPAAKFKDINVYNDENDDNAIVVTVSYSVKIGNKTEETTVAIKL
jgi:phage baseplate assembly protein W